jgi:hypothetical protein
VIGRCWFASIYRSKRPKGWMKASLAVTDSSGTRSMRLLRNRKGFQLLSKADNAV